MSYKGGTTDSTGTKVVGVAGPPRAAVPSASWRTISGIAIFQFALTYIERTSSDVIPLFISQFTESALLIYLVTALNPLFNIINQPYIGWKGDHIWTRFGRRRPFIIFGVPMTALFVILTPYASLTATPYVWAFFFIFWYQFFNDIAWGAYQPLFGEMIPVHQRGKVSGIQQVAGAMGAFCCLAFGLGILMAKPDKIPRIFAWLPEPILSLPERLPTYLKGYYGAFGLGGVVFILAMIALVALVRERKPETILPKGRFNLFGYYKELFGSKQYIVLVILMIVLNLISQLIGSVMQLFAKNTLGLTPAEAGAIISIDPLLALALAYPIGWLADKLSRRKIMVLSLSISIITCITALMATSSQWMYPLVGLWGVARTLQFVAFVPLIVDYIEPGRMGTFIGGVAQARGIAVFLMFPVVGWSIDFFRVNMEMGDQAYRVPFAMAIGCCLLAGFLLYKLGKSRFVENS